MVQPATALIPETEGEEGVVWSGHVLSGTYLTDLTEVCENPGCVFAEPEYR